MLFDRPGLEARIELKSRMRSRDLRRYAHGTVQVELENYPGVSGKFCFLIVTRTYPTVG